MMGLEGMKGMLPLVLAVGVACAGCGGEGSGSGQEAPEGGPAAGGADEAVRPAPADGATLVEGSDIWVGEFTESGGSVTISELRNVTGRPGYDNQPHFRSDGSSILYTSMDEAGQADIWRYDLTDGRSVPVVRTRPESEYSPTPLPRSGGFSVIRVEADSTQRLWSFGPDGRDPTLLIEDVAPVGYHAWAGGSESSMAALFVLGDPPTLRIWDGETGRSRTVAEDIGRSIQPVPGTRGVSFAQRSGSDFRIMQWGAGGISELAEAPPGTEYHAWTPEGTLLMAGGLEGPAAREIVAWRPEWGEWRTVGTVPEGGRVTRLAVAPRGNRIAVVVESGGEG